jgi:glutamate synthase (NADPH/NADH) large chain
VVQAGIDALKAVWHRGAVDADGKTGDGAASTSRSRRTSSPRRWSAAATGAARPHRGGHGVPAQDRPRRAGALPADRRDRDPVRRLRHHSWRQVPINVGCIGEKANATRPEIEQILVWNPAARTTRPTSATCT